MFKFEPQKKIIFDVNIVDQAFALCTGLSKEKEDFNVHEYFEYRYVLCKFSL